MYNLLLVDDEKLVLEALRDHIDWHGMGIKIIGTAKNGKEALQLCETLKPDIVLTDVKMPVMDGLVFARKAKDSFGHIKVAFLSGFDEFKYIKTAMEVEAVDYLLKPVNIDELQVMISKIKYRLEQEKLTSKSKSTLLEKYLKELLFEKDTAKKAQLLESIKLVNTGQIISIGDTYTLALISIDGYGIYCKRKDEQQGILLGSGIRDALIDFTDTRTKSGIVINIRNDEFCVLMKAGTDSGMDCKALWREFSDSIRETLSTSVTVLLSYDVCNLLDAGNMYDKMEKTLPARFYSGHGLIIPAGGSEAVIAAGDIQLPSIQTNLLSAICSLNTEEAEKCIEDFYRFISEKKPSPDHVKAASFNLLNGICEYFEKNAEIIYSVINSKNEIHDNTFYQDTLEGIRHYVLDFVECIAGYIKVKSRDSTQQVVNKIISTLERSYNKPITVEDISKDIYLSPNYIRAIFKEKVGETILEYLTKLRIRKAEELLYDKSLKIHEISALVGYENVSYFCSLFQKYKGITPNDYRKKLL